MEVDDISAEAAALVRLAAPVYSGGPTAPDDVREIKELSARLIDAILRTRAAYPAPTLRAVNKVQEACMLAVYAATAP